uniref:Ferritin n=1 Tax=Rhinolophus ferrumequinum TaxID=59479 RepID=A0A671DLL2_RHIFE
MANAMTTPLPQSVHQNSHPDCLAAINNHINLELHASYVYLSMAFYFDRDYVALKHFAQFFLQQSREETENAERLMQLQNQRGGQLRLCNITKLEQDERENGLKARECALNLEKQMNQSLLNLYQLATNKKDAHLCDFLRSHYLHEKVKFIKAPESSLAEYLFDKLTLGDSEEKN